MDGELDISNKDIKGSIDDVLAEDVFEKTYLKNTFHKSIYYIYYCI